MTSDVSAARCFKVILVIASLIYRSCYSLNGAYPPQTYRRLSAETKRQLISADEVSFASGDLKINIYDNLFDIETCNQLHRLACSHSDRIGDDSTLFYRNVESGDHSEQPFSPLESVLNNLLTVVLNDTSTRVVEYWSRQEYLNMDTHCDVDEYILDKQKRVRCPEWAHILYLRLQPNVTAPTCIFPMKKGGWESSLREHDNAAATLDVVVIPAVSGRLVRFPGNLMHSVPKPPHRWFLSKDDDITMQEQQQEEETSGSTVHCIERSVILFNCWSNTSPPPRGSLQGKAFGTVPDGIVLDDDGDHYNTHAPNTSSDDNPSFSFIKTSPLLDDWHSTPIFTTIAGEFMTPNHDELRIRLMGNQRRRKHRDAVVKFQTRSSKALWNALHEPHQPSYTKLRRL
jgi:hypothetical protein